METKNLNRQLFILPAILSIWLILSSALIAWFDPLYFPVIILFTLFACILCLTYSLRILGWILAVIGAAVYFAIHFSISSFTGSDVRMISLGVFSILGAAVLCTFIGEQLTQLSTQIRYGRKMIEELRIIDPVTGLVRFHYARKTLNTEVARCQRYNKLLSLLVARVSNWNELVDAKGIDDAQQVMAQVGEQFRRSIRNVDIGFVNIEKLGVILPETKIEGAVQVAQRILENCAKRAKVNMNIGIATFPTDAILDADLIRTAESALQISMSSGQPIVFYSQVHQAIDDTTTETAVARKKRGLYQQDALEEQMIAQVLPPYREDSMPATQAGISESAESWINADVQETDPLEREPNEPDPLYGKPFRSEGDEEGKPENLEVNKTDWVKPYRPPVANLHLETMEPHSAGEGAEKNRDVLIGIHGVDELAALPEIEKALNDLKSVKKVSMVDYTEKTLVLKVSHHSDDILEEIRSDLKLPYADVRSGKEWIEVTLKKE